MYVKNHFDHKLVYACLFFFTILNWKQTKTEATISWDVSGYYIYLPAFYFS